MADLQKHTEVLDSDQVLEFSYNNSDKTISTSAFITSQLGNKIVRTLEAPTIETYEYFGTGLSGLVSLYTIQVTYTDSTLTTIAEVERIA